MVFFFTFALLCLSCDEAGNRETRAKREQMRIKHLTCFLKCPIKIADTFWPYFFGIPYKSLTVIPHAIIVADGLMLLSFHTISFFWILLFLFLFNFSVFFLFWVSLSLASLLYEKSLRAGKAFLLLLLLYLCVQVLLLLGPKRA